MRLALPRSSLAVSSLKLRRERGLFGLCFAVGLVLSLFMATRGRIYEDQFRLLSLGWSLTQESQWVPYGNPTSAGGYVPGGLTSFLVGLPLLVWRDYRAPSFLIVVLHVLAFWLLDRMLQRIVTVRGRFLFCVLYWLSPWRLYFSAFLWNPNYLFFFGALHTYTCFSQRHRPSFLHSLLHVLAIGGALQVHASFVILAIASLLLYSRGYFKLRWTAVACGGGLILLSLLPWMIHAQRHPEILPIGQGFLGRGLVFVYPVVRGLLYWLRYSSLSLSQSMIRFDFTNSPAEDAAFVLVPVLFVLTRVLGPLSIVLPFLANLRLWRAHHRRLLDKPSATVSTRVWLRGFIAWTFIAAFISFCLAPTTVMMWQGFLVMHVAVFPLILWLTALLRTRQAAWVVKGLELYIPVVLFLSICLSLGGPMYARAGGPAPDAVLHQDPAMLNGLGLAPE